MSTHEDIHVDEAVTVDDHSEADAFVPPTPDPVLVEKIKAEALIQAGYSTEDDDGNVRSDFKQLQAGVLQAMQENHVVSNKRDLGTGAVTQFELYQEILPGAPGVQSLARTLEEEEAQGQLTKALWSYVNVGTSSFVQKHSVGLGMVLCEARVARTKVHEETGKRQPGTERGRFLTADGELIMTYFTGPAGAAFVKAARKLDAQLGLVRERRPELAAPVAKQLSSVVKQAVSSVPHADPKQVNELTSGQHNETEGT